MGRCMTVVLKAAHRNDLFISLLNQQLAREFGGNVGTTFVTQQYVEQEADFINTDPEGLKQLPHWKRPVTAAQLSRNFFWYRIGEFSFKLSGCSGSDEARDAIAVCKWIQQTKGRYIELKASENYRPAVVREYLDHLFSEAGYSIDSLWTTIKRSDKN